MEIGLVYESVELLELVEVGAFVEVGEFLLKEPPPRHERRSSNWHRNLHFFWCEKIGAA